MNKKICIVTLYDTNNYGNRLQNYAVQQTVKKTGYGCESLINVKEYSNIKNKLKNFLKFFLKRRYRSFILFNKNIKFSNIKIDNSKILTKEKTNILNRKYEYFITGSDQVWNPTLKRFNKLELLYFVGKSKKRIAFSASFGIEKLPTESEHMFTNELKKFKNISVREEAGKKIVKELIETPKPEVLIDPTMLLTAQEWDKVSKKPKQLKNIKEDKYILNYFLGELSESRKKEIEKIAKENNCHIINILDKEDPFYACGPSEFLYLEKNAFLICTDSFHSCVFAILYNTPFVIFDREDKAVNMNTRINTLLSKFKLEDRRFNGKKITKENLKHDYTEAYKILEKERKKSEDFLKKALDIE